MLIHCGAKFITHKRTPQATQAAIRLRITLRGQRPFDVPLGHTVALADWNATAGRLAPTDKHHRTVNHQIDQWRGALEDIIARWELVEKRTPTPKELREEFLGAIGRGNDEGNAQTKELTLWDVYDMFVVTMAAQNQWTIATKQKFAALRKQLHDYNPHLNLNTLTAEQLQGFVIYLTQHGKRNTTIAKTISFLRWFLRWANQYGHYTGRLHDTYRPKLKGTDGNQKEVIYLTLDELHLLQTQTFTTQQTALEHVRDVFLFCCFTGLRYSDAAKLRRHDIHNGIIHVVTQKTVDGLRIELNQHSKAILDKYNNTDDPNGLALPIVSNQKMNQHLKELGKLCQLNTPTHIVYFRGNNRIEETLPKWQLLTTHCARRTFVVTALQLGIASEVIMKWTGHSDHKAMKPYVKIVDNLKAQSMQRFDLL